MWFKALTGFRETSPDDVRNNMLVDGNRITSQTNNRAWLCGQLQTPSLGELREHVQQLSETLQTGNSDAGIYVNEVVADVQDLHTDAANTGALFQVASQFNLLEMVSPRATPEDGVDIYELDRTQGPACAIACGAGLIYRNYFADVNGQRGQSSDNQIDCLRDVGIALGNENESLWKMQNGYALATASGLDEINKQLGDMSETERDSLRQLLRVGIQSDTQVTLNDCQHTVTQVYGSALPVAYSSHSAGQWEQFARLTLEASYEATMCAAVLNLASTGVNKVFLTMLGGGAFGNDTTWITDALRRSFTLFEGTSLDISIVSYGRSSKPVRELISSLQTA